MYSRNTISFAFEPSNTSILVHQRKTILHRKKKKPAKKFYLTASTIEINTN